MHAGAHANSCAHKKVCNENTEQQVLNTRLLEGSEHGIPSMKREKEDHFVAKDIEPLSLKVLDTI